MHMRAQIRIEKWVPNGQVNNDPNTHPADIDMSAQNYLAVLIEMAWVFLQDASILMDMYPNHPCYSLRVFKTDKWPRFKEEVMNFHTNAEAYPAQVRLSIYFDAHQIHMYTIMFTDARIIVQDNTLSYQSQNAVLRIDLQASKDKIRDMEAQVLLYLDLVRKFFLVLSDYCYISTQFN
jgi:hypothetical protein